MPKQQTSGEILMGKGKILIMDDEVMIQTMMQQKRRCLLTSLSWISQSPVVWEERRLPSKYCHYIPTPLFWFQAVTPMIL